MGLVILLGAFALGIAAGMPVAFAMGIAAASAFLFEGFPMLITFQRAMAGVTVFLCSPSPFSCLPARSCCTVASRSAC